MKKSRQLGALCAYVFIFVVSSTHAMDYTITNLGTLGGPSSSGEGINNSGQVTGGSRITGNTAGHAFLYDGSIMHDLGTLGDGLLSFGYGINNNGQVTGQSATNGYSNNHAFLYDGSIMHDLGTLGGATSVGNDINDNGWVTGVSVIAGNTANHAFLYDGSTMQDLGTLGGATYSEGHDINNHGWVVGDSGLDAGAELYGAFLYDGSSMMDLCVLTDCIVNGWDRLNTARGINDYGDITGYGTINGERRAFLISAVPIPPALWLFGSGLLGLVGVARRKKL